MQISFAMLLFSGQISGKDRSFQGVGETASKGEGALVDKSQR